jgi:hypothetical protein
VAIFSMVLLAGTAAGCSKTQITESVARNVAALAGSAQFDTAGYPLQDVLTCQTASAGDTIAVTCIGTTKAGQPVTMIGQVTTDSSSEERIQGAVVGAVDGTEVFRKDCIGDC